VACKLLREVSIKAARLWFANLRHICTESTGPALGLAGPSSTVSNNPSRRPRLQSELTVDQFRLFMEQESVDNKTRDQMISKLKTEISLVSKKQDVMHKDISQLNKTIMEVLRRGDLHQDSTPGSASKVESLPIPVVQQSVPLQTQHPPDCDNPEKYPFDNKVIVSCLVM
jgi:hypothetical protein